MGQKYYILYLLPPRPSFMQDMTEEERAVMLKHLEYWNDMMNKGIAKVFGPVMDPKGVYGMGIVEVENEEQLNTVMKNDPANGLNRYEAYPMRAVLPTNI